jgi:hypothetical protein
MRSVSDKKFVRRGKRVEVTGLTNKKVKFLLHKFLHTNHLTKYSVLATADTFQIVRVESEEKQAEEDEPLKRPTPIWVPIHPPPTAVEPSLVIEWQGQPPRNKIRSKRK